MAYETCRRCSFVAAIPAGQRTEPCGDAGARTRSTERVAQPGRGAGRSGKEASRRAGGGSAPGATLSLAFALALLRARYSAAGGAGRRLGRLSPTKDREIARACRAGGGIDGAGPWQRPGSGITKLAHGENRGNPPGSDESVS